MADTAAAIVRSDTALVDRALTLRQLAVQVAAIVGNLRHSQALAAP